jgi:hypothetical protein
VVPLEFGKRNDFVLASELEKLCQKVAAVLGFDLEGFV